MYNYNFKAHVTINLPFPYCKNLLDLEFGIASAQVAQHRSLLILRYACVVIMSHLRVLADI